MSEHFSKDGESAPSLTRAERALLTVLPPTVRENALTERGLVIGGRALRVDWVRDGNLPDVRRLLEEPDLPHVVASRVLSPGAREALSTAGVSWVDETGAAAIALDTIIVSREGRPVPSPPTQWTPASLAVAESLLCGHEATVTATQQATGLSTGSCATALRFLTDAGLLEADAARGRNAGRRVRDPDALLASYANAADGLRPRAKLQVGVVWRDPVAGLGEVGRKWESHGRRWCATGAAAAELLAPYLTTVGSSEVYVDANTSAGLEAYARDAELRPIEGGRLTLRPIPTAGVRRFATRVDELWVAPWPRVYVDLRSMGVRGEEAAEHLREVLDV